MKKLLSMLLIVTMLFTFAGCKGNDNTANDTSKTDAEYVLEKGTLVVGITDFEPMDYRDESGEWVGFDADMAKGFAEKLGVDVEFIEIDWDNKIFELNSKQIDCVWNGMTLTDEVVSSMECSNAYSNNSQVVVVKDATKYSSVNDLVGATVAVEAGSAGSEELDNCNVECEKLEVKTQADALLEVYSGTSDACVIDYAMAAAMIKPGSSYEGLSVIDNLNAELYGVGFRKDSDLAQKLNDYFKETYGNGKLMEVANTYGIQDTIITQ